MQREEEGEWKRGQGVDCRAECCCMMRKPLVRGVLCPREKTDEEKGL
jgi:hypothetical protein